MTITTPMRRPFLKTTALGLLLSFIAQDLSYAQGGVSASKSPAVREAKFPGELAVSQEKYLTLSRETIIHIQDAHDSLEAQQKITAVLNSLSKDYDVRSVALEGSSGAIDPLLFTSYPDRSVAERSAETLLREGRLNAGEFFAITSETPVSVYGAEERTLYRENLKAFQDLLKNREKIERDLSGLSRTLRVLGERIYGPEIRALRAGTVDGADPGDFSKRLRTLGRLARGKNIPTGGYRNLNILSAVSDLESRIDFPKANDERRSLLSRFQELLKGEDLEEVMRRSLEFKAGKLTDSQFHLFIRNSARRQGMDMTGYPNLTAYIGYLELFDTVDLPGLLNESEDLEEKLKEACFASADERTLDIAEKDLKVLMNLVSGTASSKEFETYLSSPNVKLSSPQSFVLLTQKYQVPLYDGAKLENILGALPAAVRFYGLARQRDAVLIRNTLKKMREGNQTAAVLVTGGFHARGISDVLKSEHLSHLVILPKITDPNVKRPYLTILTKKRGQYEKAFRSDHSRFKILLGNPLLDRGRANGLLGLAGVKAVLKPLVEGLRDRKAFERWMETYERGWRGEGNQNPYLRPENIRRLAGGPSAVLMAGARLAEEPDTIESLRKLYQKMRAHHANELIAESPSADVLIVTAHDDVMKQRFEKHLNALRGVTFRADIPVIVDTGPVHDGRTIKIGNGGALAKSLKTLQDELPRLRKEYPHLANKKDVSELRILIVQAGGFGERMLLSSVAEPKPLVPLPVLLPNKQQATLLDFSIMTGALFTRELKRRGQPGIVNLPGDVAVISDAWLSDGINLIVSPKKKDEVIDRFGVIIVDAEGRADFREKPSRASLDADPLLKDKEFFLTNTAASVVMHRRSEVYKGYIRALISMGEWIEERIRTGKPVYGIDTSMDFLETVTAPSLDTYLARRKAVREPAKREFFTRVYKTVMESSPDLMILARRPHESYFMDFASLTDWLEAASPDSVLSRVTEDELPFTKSFALEKQDLSTRAYRLSGRSAKTARYLIYGDGSLAEVSANSLLFLKHGFEGDDSRLAVVYVSPADKLEKPVKEATLFGKPAADILRRLNIPFDDKTLLEDVPMWPVIGSDEKEGLSGLLRVLKRGKVSERYSALPKVSFREIRNFRPAPETLGAREPEGSRLAAGLQLPREEDFRRWLTRIAQALHETDDELSWDEVAGVFSKHPAVLKRLGNRIIELNEWLTKEVLPMDYVLGTKALPQVAEEKFEIVSERLGRIGKSALLVQRRETAVPPEAVTAALERVTREAGTLRTLMIDPATVSLLDGNGKPYVRLLRRFASLVKDPDNEYFRAKKLREEYARILLNPAVRREDRQLWLNSFLDEDRRVLKLALTSLAYQLRSRPRAVTYYRNLGAPSFLSQAAPAWVDFNRHAEKTRREIAWRLLYDVGHLSPRRRAFLQSETLDRLTLSVAGARLVEGEKKNVQTANVILDRLLEVGPADLGAVLQFLDSVPAKITIGVRSEMLDILRADRAKFNEYRRALERAQKVFGEGLSPEKRSELLAQVVPAAESTRRNILWALQGAVWEVGLVPGPATAPGQGARLAAEPRVVVTDPMDETKLGIPGVINLSAVSKGEKLEEALSQLKPHILIVRSYTKVNAALIDRLLPDLKAIIRGGHGLDNVDEGYASSKGIKVYGTQGSESAVAAWTLRAVAAAEQDGLTSPEDEAPPAFFTLPEWAYAMEKKIAKENDGAKKALLRNKAGELFAPVSRATIDSLKGRTIGIIGFGAVGRKIAAVSKDLGMRALVTSPSLENDRAPAKASGYEFGSKEDIYKTSHFIVLAMGLYKTGPHQNAGMIGQAAVDLMLQNKDLIALVNPDREGLVDEMAITRLIEEGRVQYLVDEVPDSDFLKNNARFTPHIAASTEQAEDGVVKNTASLLARVRPEVRDRITGARLAGYEILKPGHPRFEQIFDPALHGDDAVLDAVTKLEAYAEEAAARGVRGFVVRLSRDPAEYDRWAQAGFVPLAAPLAPALAGHLKRHGRAAELEVGKRSYTVPLDQPLEGWEEITTARLVPSRKDQPLRSELSRALEALERKPGNSERKKSVFNLLVSHLEDGLFVESSLSSVLGLPAAAQKDAFSAFSTSPELKNLLLSEEEYVQAVSEEKRKHADEERTKREAEEKAAAVAARASAIEALRIEFEPLAAEAQKKLSAFLEERLKVADTLLSKKPELVDEIRDEVEKLRGVVADMLEKARASDEPVENFQRAILKALSRRERGLEGRINDASQPPVEPEAPGYYPGLTPDDFKNWLMRVASVLSGEEIRDWERVPGVFSFKEALLGLLYDRVERLTQFIGLDAPEMIQEHAVRLVQEFALYQGSSFIPAPRRVARKKLEAILEKLEDLSCRLEKSAASSAALKTLAESLRAGLADPDPPVFRKLAFQKEFFIKFWDRGVSPEAVAEFVREETPYTDEDLAANFLAMEGIVSTQVWERRQDEDRWKTAEILERFKAFEAALPKGMRDQMQTLRVETKKIGEQIAASDMIDQLERVVRTPDLEKAMKEGTDLQRKLDGIELQVGEKERLEAAIKTLEARIDALPAKPVVPQKDLDLARSKLNRARGIISRAESPRPRPRLTDGEVRSAYSEALQLSLPAMKDLPKETCSVIRDIDQSYFDWISGLQADAEKIAEPSDERRAALERAIGLYGELKTFLDKQDPTTEEMFSHTLGLSDQIESRIREAKLLAEETAAPAEEAAAPLVEREVSLEKPEEVIETPYEIRFSRKAFYQIRVRYAMSSAFRQKFNTLVRELLTKGEKGDLKVREWKGLASHRTDGDSFRIYWKNDGNRFIYVGVFHKDQTEKPNRTGAVYLTDIAQLSASQIPLVEKSRTDAFIRETTGIVYRRKAMLGNGKSSGARLAAMPLSEKKAKELLKYEGVLYRNYGEQDPLRIAVLERLKAKVSFAREKFSGELYARALEQVLEKVQTRPWARFAGIVSAVKGISDKKAEDDFLLSFDARSFGQKDGALFFAKEILEAEPLEMAAEFVFRELSKDAYRFTADDFRRLFPENYEGRKIEERLAARMDSFVKTRVRILRLDDLFGYLETVFRDVSAGRKPSHDNPKLIRILDHLEGRYLDDRFRKPLGQIEAKKKNFQIKDVLASLNGLGVLESALRDTIEASRKALYDGDFPALYAAQDRFTWYYAMLIGAGVKETGRWFDEEDGAFDGEFDEFIRQHRELMQREESQRDLEGLRELAAILKKDVLEPAAGHESKAVSLLTAKAEALFQEVSGAIQRVKAEIVPQTAVVSASGARLAEAKGISVRSWGDEGSNKDFAELYKNKTYRNFSARFNDTDNPHFAEYARKILYLLASDDRENDRIDLSQWHDDGTVSFIFQGKKEEITLDHELWGELWKYFVEVLRGIAHGEIDLNAAAYDVLWLTDNSRESLPKRSLDWLTPPLRDSITALAQTKRQRVMAGARLAAVTAEEQKVSDPLLAAVAKNYDLNEDDLSQARHKKEKVWQVPGWITQRITYRHELDFPGGKEPVVFYTKEYQSPVFSWPYLGKLAVRFHNRRIRHEAERALQAAAFGLSPEVHVLHTPEGISMLLMTPARVRSLMALSREERSSQDETEIVNKLGYALGMLHSLGLIHGDLVQYSGWEPFFLRMDHIFWDAGQKKISFIDFGASRKASRRAQLAEKRDVFDVLTDFAKKTDRETLEQKFDHGYLRARTDYAEIGGPSDGARLAISYELDHEEVQKGIEGTLLRLVEGRDSLRPLSPPPIQADMKSKQDYLIGAVKKLAGELGGKHIQDTDGKRYTLFAEGRSDGFSVDILTEQRERVGGFHKRLDLETFQPDGEDARARLVISDGDAVFLDPSYRHKGIMPAVVALLSHLSPPGTVWVGEIADEETIKDLWSGLRWTEDEKAESYSIELKAYQVAQAIEQGLWGDAKKRFLGTRTAKLLKYFGPSMELYSGPGTQYSASLFVKVTKPAPKDPLEAYQIKILDYDADWEKVQETMRVAGKVLTREQEFLFFRALHARNLDVDQRNALRQFLFNQNMGLIKSFVRYLSPYQIKEARQEAALNLLRAIAIFDPDRGFKFSTCAILWIRQAVQRIARKQKSYSRLRSLDKRPGSDQSENTLAALIPSKRYGPDAFEEASITHDLPRILSVLDERAREILMMYFGENRTLEEIGRLYKITRERVRQIVKRSLELARKGEKGKRDRYPGDPKFKELLRKHKANRKTIAQELGVGRKAVSSWIRKQGLREFVKELRAGGKGNSPSVDPQKRFRLLPPQLSLRRNQKFRDTAWASKFGLAGARLAQVLVYRNYGDQKTVFEFDGKRLVEAATAKQFAEGLKRYGFTVSSPGPEEEVSFARFENKDRHVEFADVEALRSALNKAIGKPEDYWQKDSGDRSFERKNVKVAFRLEERRPWFSGKAIQDWKEKAEKIQKSLDLYLVDSRKGRFVREFESHTMMQRLTPEGGSPELVVHFLPAASDFFLPFEILETRGGLLSENKKAASGIFEFPPPAGARLAEQNSASDEEPVQGEHKFVYRGKEIEFLIHQNERFTLPVVEQALKGYADTHADFSNNFYLVLQTVLGRTIAVGDKNYHIKLQSHNRKRHSFWLDIFENAEDSVMNTPILISVKIKFTSGARLAAKPVEDGTALEERNRAWELLKAGRTEELAAMGPKLIPVIRRAVEDKRESVRETALFALAKLKDPQVFPVLREMLNVRDVVDPKDPASYEKAAARVLPIVRALDDLGDTRAAVELAGKVSVLDDIVYERSKSEFFTAFQKMAEADPGSLQSALDLPNDRVKSLVRSVLLDFSKKPQVYPDKSAYAGIVPGVYSRTVLSPDFREVLYMVNDLRPEIEQILRKEIEDGEIDRLWALFQGLKSYRIPWRLEEANLFFQKNLHIDVNADQFDQLNRLIHQWLNTPPSVRLLRTHTVIELVKGETLIVGDRRISVAGIKGSQVSLIMKEGLDAEALVLQEHDRLDLDQEGTLRISVPFVLAEYAFIKVTAPANVEVAPLENAESHSRDEKVLKEVQKLVRRLESLRGQVRQTLGKHTTHDTLEKRSALNLALRKTRERIFDLVIGRGRPSGARLVKETKPDEPVILIGAADKELREKLSEAFKDRKDIRVIRIGEHLSAEDKLKTLEKKGARLAAAFTIFYDDDDLNGEAKLELIRRVSEADFAVRPILGELLRGEKEFADLPEGARLAVYRELIMLLPAIAPKTVTAADVRAWQPAEAFEQFKLQTFHPSFGDPLENLMVESPEDPRAAVWSLSQIVSDPFFFDALKDRDQKLRRTSMKLDDHVIVPEGTDLEKILGERTPEFIRRFLKQNIHETPDGSIQFVYAKLEGRYKRENVLFIDKAEKPTLDDDDPSLKFLTTRGEYTVTPDKVVTRILARSGSLEGIFFKGLRQIGNRFFFELQPIDFARQFKSAYLALTETRESA